MSGTLKTGANLSILSVCLVASYIMLSGSVCIIDDIVTIWYGVFPQ
jgi:hypothetical protein